MFDPPYRQLFIGVVAAVVVGGLGLLGYRGAPKKHGWKRVDNVADRRNDLLPGDA